MTLEVTRGKNATLDLTIVDRDGELVDLTAVYLWFTAKLELSDTDDDAVIYKTTVDGITVDPDQVTNTGEAAVAIEPADTLGLNNNGGHVLHWDLQSYDNSEVRVLASGTLVVKASVTMATAP